MRRSSAAAAGGGLSLAELSRGAPPDAASATVAASTASDDDAAPIALSAPPVCTDASWAPAQIVKSSSDPNIARLPGKLVSRFLTRFLTLVLRRSGGVSQLVAMLVAEFVCALRKSPWLLEVLGTNVAVPVAKGVVAGARGRAETDGIPCLGLNSPRPSPPRRAQQMPAAKLPAAKAASKSAVACPPVAPSVCATSSSSRTPSPRGSPLRRSSSARANAMPALTLGAVFKDERHLKDLETAAVGIAFEAAAERGRFG